jgi:Uma2 family endonuclease
MGRLKSALPRNWTLADVRKHLGVPLHRIRLFPAPGLATERDLLAAADHEDRLCELIDGVLVEKTMGIKESMLASEINRRMGNFVAERRSGILTVPDGFLRLLPGQVRAPDVSYISFDQLPNRKAPVEPIPDLVPDLAVEVLSAGNTKKEMTQKLRDYFLAGVRLVWFIDPDKRLGQIYTAPDEMRLVTENEAMDGGDVLPGFELPLRELFALLPDEPAKRHRPRRPRGTANGR